LNSDKKGAVSKYFQIQGFVYLHEIIKDFGTGNPSPTTETRWFLLVGDGFPVPH